MHRRTFLTITAAAVATGGASFGAAPSRLIDGRFSQFGGGGDPDHSVWDAVLAKGLRKGADGIARFDYGRVDQNALRGYVQALASVDPRGLSRPAAFAYWSNLYNAVTVSVVAEAYPVRSIRRIGGSLLSPGPWRAKQVKVAGVDLSLDDIEHGILRPVWRDPLVHYAVNCAALGCPNLLGTAYRSQGLSAQLEVNARAFVNHPRGVQVTSNGVVVSSIYHWFKSDFGGNDAGVLDHLRRYAGQNLVGQLQGARRIADHRYDWSLNGA